MKRLSRKKNAAEEDDDPGSPAKGRSLSGPFAGLPKMDFANGLKALKSLRLSNPFANKGEAEEEEREDWEDWDWQEFKQGCTIRDAPAAAAGGGGGGDGGRRSPKENKSSAVKNSPPKKKTGPPLSPGSPGGGKMKAMSAHPDDKDVSFEELMEQYRQYEKQVDGPDGMDGGSGNSRPETGASHLSEARGGTGMQRRAEVLSIMRRRELLMSQHGGGIAVMEEGGYGAVGQHGGAGGVARVVMMSDDVDFKGEPREARTPFPGDSRPATSVRWGLDTASSWGGTGGETPGTSTTGGRPETGKSEANYARVMASLMPAGDAAYFETDDMFDCSKNGLISIPMAAYSEDAGNGPALKILWAQYNRVSWVPESLGTLTSLTQLRLHHNEIEELPAQLGYLRGLKQLYLSDNKLRLCPYQIATLSKLEVLTLSRNPLTEINSAVGVLVNIKDMQLDGLQLVVPPREITVRGPGRIVEYMARVRRADLECWRYMHGDDPNSEHFVPPHTLELLKLNFDAPTQDNSTFWKPWDFFVTAQGSFGFRAKEGSTVNESVLLGNVRHLVYEQLLNKINFPFKVSFSTNSQTSVILASATKEGRNAFIRLVQDAKGLTCALELTHFGLQRMPVEAARMSVLTSLNLSSNQIRGLPPLRMPLLESLVLDNNSLPSVPPTVYQDLTGLTYLSLVDNPISRLPTDIGQMPLIQEVNVKVHFSMETPPNSVVAQKKHLRFLRVMRHAELNGMMDLSDFGLPELPNEIGKRWDENPEYHQTHTLSLADNKLTDIEQGIINWAKIKSLDLRKNRLWKLPRSLGIMLHLTELFLDNNEIRETPRSMAKLTKLVCLSMNNNDLQTWPAGVDSCTNLTELFMNHNSIEMVPATAASLVSLRQLSVNGNKISDLPQEVEAWTSLTELRINDNRLQRLPETLGLLENLEHVSFAKNTIDAFPSEVGNWVNLRSLDVAKNRIPFIPPSIENSTAMKKLVLDGNPLCQLPLGMGSMKALKRLSFTGSGKWISPPNFVMGLSSHDVIDYLHSYHNALESYRLDLSNREVEYLHADVCALSALRDLNLADNKLTTLSAVNGDASGKWIWMTGDRDTYIPDDIWQAKLRAKTAVLQYFGPGLTERLLRNKCKLIFQTIDVDGGGSLDVEELQRCFRLLKCEVSKMVVNMLIAEVSNDGDDTVDLDEWIRMVQNVYKGSVDLQGIGDLKALQVLNISRNQLLRLPYGLGFCTSLRSLVLDDPHTVLIPCEDILKTAKEDASILVRYMRLLHDASLSHSLHLHGFIMSYVPNEVIELTNLTELSMSGLSMKVVVSEISKITGLKSLDFSYNRIASLPTTLGLLTKLETLDVQSNRLMHLPPVLCNNHSLTVINVVGNKDLMIPKEVLNTNTATIKAFLRGVHEGLNTTIVNWSLLKEVGNCRLRVFPARLFTMGAVTELNLDDNQIHRIPAETGNLTSLVKLSMRHNLIDAIPDQLMLCRQLQKLFLDYNRLKAIPEHTFAKLPLCLVSLSYNQLDSSCISEKLSAKAHGQAGRHVTALILENNHIGKISSTIDVFRRLKTFNFSCNQVRTLPLELADCFSLTDLQFDCNQVFQIPDEMKALTNLVRLKFNDNVVTHLPHWVGNLSKLLHLAIGKNKLQYIPDSVTKLSLKVFTIDGNPLQSLETGLLMDGSQAVVDYLTYNHSYDQPDQDVILDGLEQRRQINAKLNEYAYAAANIDRNRLEAEYRKVGGRNIKELSYNKIVGQDRTDSEGAVIVDDEMLQDVLRIAERDLAASALSAFFGLGLTGDKVRWKAEEVFMEVDEDASGYIDIEELRQAFLQMNADVSTEALKWIMLSGGEDPESAAKVGIPLRAFQDICYNVYSSRN